MNFNIYITLESPVGTAEMPHAGNPVECENMLILLGQLNLRKFYWPSNSLQILGLEIVGLRIEEIK